MARIAVKTVGLLAVLLVALGAGIAGLSKGGVAYANPATSEPQTVSQPDSTEIDLQLWGDEFAHGWQTLDGFAVVPNSSTGYWEYAVRDDSGNLVPSGVIVGEGSPPAPPGLRPSAEVIDAARAALGAPPAGAPYAPAPPPWASGGVNKLVIMVQFPADPVDPDGAQPAVNCTFTSAQMQANLFGATATGPGNLIDYYNEVSYGAMNLSQGPAGVVGCFTVANDKNDYDDGPSSAAALVGEAVALADPSVDFAPYDNDGNTVVDNVAVVYAGGGPDDGCYTGAASPPDNLWPHASSIAPVAVDGGARTVSEYYIAPELTFPGGCTTIRTIGVFAHEFGHKLGLPDLYDTDGSSEGIGHWGLMGSGSWTSNTPGSENGESPAHMGAWSKWFMGWITPTDRTGADVGQLIPQAETSPFAVQLEPNPGGVDWAFGSAGSGEYFLIENRQQTGFDRGLDGCGIMVWHIDESLPGNNSANAAEGHTAASHRLVDPEEADGTDPMPNRGDAGDPFPGSSSNLLWTDGTNPHSRLYSGAATGNRMELVSTTCSSNMMVNLGNPTADLSVSKSATPDPVLAGEELYYNVTVTNWGPGIANNVVVTDTYPSPSVGEGAAGPANCDDGTDNDGDTTTDFLDSECAGLRYVTDTDSCVEAPVGTLTCSLGDIGVSGSSSFQIKLEVSPTFLAFLPGAPDAAPITNTATATSDETDPNPTNDTAGATVLVEDSADLEVKKICKPDDVVPAGDTIECSIFVDNHGPSAARNVQMEDTLLIEDGVDWSLLSVECTGQPGCTVDILSPPPPPLDPSGAIIRAFLPVLPPRAPGDTSDPPSTGRFRVVVELVVNETTDLNNEAIVTSDSPDPDPSNNQAEDGLHVADVADLNLTKTDAPDPVAAGGTLTYTLVVTNNGPSTAQNVVVEDLLPFGTSLVSATASSGNCTTSVPVGSLVLVTCNMGTVPSGGSRTVTIVVTVNPDVPPGSILFNGGVTRSDFLDLDTSDNVALASTTVTFGTTADLSIEKVDRPDPVMAGDQLYYDIRVDNAGPGFATQVVVTDTLPAGITHITDTAGCVFAAGPPPTLTCNLTPGEGGAGGPANCAGAVDDDGDTLVDNDDPECAIPPGGSHSFTVKMQVPPDYLTNLGPPIPSAASITNTAVVTANETDPILTNNSASEGTIVDDMADLRLTKECKPDEPILVGGIATCTILVDNLGPSDAQDVEMTDLILSQDVTGTDFSIVSVTVDPAGPAACTIDGAAVPPPPPNVDITDGSAVIICPLGTEPAGGRTTIVIEVTSTEPVDVNDVAAVASSTFDPDTSNNMDTESITFTEAADLKVTKLCKPDEPLPAGETGTCTILVDNLGPSTAQNVVLRDTHVSEGVFAFGAIASDMGACGAPVGGVVTCNLGNMAPGDRATVTIDLSADDPQDINDDADVTSDTLDPYLLNNQSQDGFTVVGSADLVIGKTAAPDPVTAGTNLTYTIDVTNNGPSVATGVVVEDVLPAGVSMLSATPSQGSCNAGVPGDPLQPLTCNLGTLAVGGSESITVVVLVDPSVPAGTVLVNNALVRSDFADPVPGNNVVSVTDTDVVTSADLAITKTAPANITGDEIEIFQLHVENLGPSDAQAVLVVDTFEMGLPLGRGLRVVSAPAYCLILDVGLTLSCDLGTLAPGAAVDIFYDVKASLDAPDDPVITDTATVSSATPDPVAGNNTDTHDTTWMDPLEDLLIGFPCVFRDVGRGTAMGVDAAAGRIRFLVLGPDDNSYDSGVVPAWIRTVGSTVYVNARTPSIYVMGSGACPLGPGRFSGFESFSDPRYYLYDDDPNN